MLQGSSSIAYEFEPVMSMADLQDAIKYLQASRPRAKLNLHVAGEVLPVKMLPNGFIEFSGQVQVPRIEKAIEQDMLSGAWLMVS